MKVLISGLLIAAFLSCYSWVLVLIPFFPYGGLFFSPPSGREWLWLPGFMEALVGFGFFSRWLLKPKDKLGCFLLLLALTGVPSLFNAANLPFSCFLTLSMVFGVGLYGFWRDTIDWQLAKRVPEFAFGTWILLGLGVKFWDHLIVGSPWWMQRSGGIWAANHGAGILFLLLPFVTSRLLVAAFVLYVVLSFSRGVYLVSALVALAYLVSGRAKESRARKKWMIVIAAAAVISISLFTMPDDTRFLMEGYLTERLVPRGASLREGAVQGIVQRAETDERWEIYRSAIEMSSENSFLGVGLGGFQWALQERGQPGVYSNAHNLYLTALAEGGAIFLFGLSILLAYLLRLAWCAGPPFVIALFAWCVYGLLNGQLWEAAGIATAGDYLVLLFFAAFLSNPRPGAIGCSPAGEVSAQDQA